MRYILVGYGKMGKSIEKEAKKRWKTNPAAVFTSQNQHHLTPHTLRQLAPDLAFEFTTGESAPRNLKILIEAQVPVVCGTTAWEHKLEEIKNYCETHGGKVIYSPNFSTGINVLLKILPALAKTLKFFTKYYIREWHHAKKKDHPSGTAKRIAETLVKYSGVLEGWLPYHGNDFKHEIQHSKKLPVLWFREDEIVGIHELIMESEVEKLSIRHEAKDRALFARGAVLAGEWLLNQPPGFYSYEELLSSV